MSPTPWAMAGSRGVAPPLEKNIKKKFGGGSYIKYYIIFPIKYPDRKYMLDLHTWAGPASIRYENNIHL